MYNWEFGNADWTLHNSFLTSKKWIFHILNKAKNRKQLLVSPDLSLSGWLAKHRKISEVGGNPANNNNLPHSYSEDERICLCQNMGRESDGFPSNDN